MAIASPIRLISKLDAIHSWSRQNESVECSWGDRGKGDKQIRGILASIFPQINRASLVDKAEITPPQPRNPRFLPPIFNTGLMH